jgi:hypothetical protein
MSDDLNFDPIDQEIRVREVRGAAREATRRPCTRPGGERWPKRDIDDERRT